MNKRIFLMLTVVAAWAAVASSTAQAGVAGHLRMAIDSAAMTADYSKTGTRQQFVVLQEWQTTRARDLKAANPGLKVLMYKNLSFMGAADSGGRTGTGVTTQEAAANPSWYLLNTSGQRFTSWSYSYLWAADIGNASYQQRWATNVVNKLSSTAFDGVYVDDVNPTMKYHYNVSEVAKYPSDAAYSAATGAALATIGPKVRGAGKVILCNFGTWRMFRSTVNGWLDSVDGGMEEQFVKWGAATVGSGYAPEADWKLMLGAAKDAAAKGKYWMGIAHSANNDAEAARYGWATTLLAANGRSTFALHGDYTNETWFPEYDYAIGDPTGPETTDASGVHRRVFTSGLVVVNPTASNQTVALNGTYSGSGLKSATSATLAPHTGLVLTRDGGAVTAPTTTTTTPTTSTTTPTTTVTTTTTVPTTTTTTTPTTTTTTVPTTTTTTTPTTSTTTTPTTTTTTTTTTTGKRHGRKPRARTARVAAQRVTVKRVTVKTANLRSVRRLLSCPATAPRCEIAVSVVVRTGDAVRRQGYRKVVLRKGQRRLVTVKLASAAAVRAARVAKTR